jgi:hypothetical protein
MMVEGLWARWCRYVETAMESPRNGRLDQQIDGRVRPNATRGGTPSSAIDE